MERMKGFCSTSQTSGAFAQEEEDGIEGSEVSFFLLICICSYVVFLCCSLQRSRLACR